MDKRIKKSIETLKIISEPCEFGTQRQSYTEAYKEGAVYVKRTMEEYGLNVHVDGIGNVTGTLIGTKPDLPKIISGSHLDTVLCAGAFDGIAGVVCAMEVAKLIVDSNNPLRHTYQVIGMVGEEGTRFGKALLGSQFIAGIYSEKQLHKFRGSEDNKTMYDAMIEYGLSGDISNVSKKDEKVKAFIEIHGEQGPVLEKEQKMIGVVESIVGLSWLKISVIGQTNHSGTVPMDYRKDAAIGAYNLILNMNEYVCTNYTGKATITEGKIQLSPNSLNSIPGYCDFTLDIRSGEEEIIVDILNKLDEFKNEVKRKCRVEIVVDEQTRKKPILMDKHLKNILDEQCAKMGYASMRINSGAGHDSMVFAEMWKTAMIFLATKNGISHNPDEWIDYKDMVAGAKVLYELIRKLDEGD